MGESQFGTGGPDLMAVSPDGETVAILDRYAATPRINFYADGLFVADLQLKDIPLAMAINNELETYALYQEVPTSRVARLTASGEVVEIIRIPGDLDPTDIFWVGSDVYVRVAVGGTEDGGYLCVVQGGATLPAVNDAEVRGNIIKEYPVASGGLTLQGDGMGSWTLARSADGKVVEAMRLMLPPELEEAAVFPFGSTRDGAPVLMAFSSFDDGRSSIGHFLAVDLLTATVKTATVSFTWRLPGGMAVVGPDAVFVMSPDKNGGVHILRVPFK